VDESATGSANLWSVVVGVAQLFTAYGPTNNGVGIGQALRERGHRVVVVIEESFASSLEVQGFEEQLMRVGSPPEVEKAPGQFWKDFHPRSWGNGQRRGELRAASAALG